jgi:hypothetical protein
MQGRKFVISLISVIAIGSSNKMGGAIHHRSK